MTQQQPLDLLCSTLNETLLPQTRAKAEATLQEMEKQPQFTLLLLELIKSSSVPESVRFAACLLFKNFVKRYWAEQETIINAQDRKMVKQNILDLMLSLPEKFQVQLSDAVSVIAFYDYAIGQWPDLIPQLVSKFSATDYHRNYGVLMTCHSMFKRYRSAMRSDDLFLEIKSVLEVFCEPYTELVKNTDALIQENAGNLQALKVLFQCLFVQCKIYYSLNYQDIPAYFEDAMPVFMPIFLKYLSYDNAALDGDSDEAGVLVKMKTCICEIVDLYAKKYEELFEMLPKFVEAIWNLLGRLSMDGKYDRLVSTAITFLASVVKQTRHKHLFAAQGAVQALCEKVVLPNIQFRESDEELFEDDPIEYIRRDLEGSDSDTRRHASTLMIRSLMEQFEAELTPLFGGFIENHLQKYSQNPSANWKDKDLAIYLLISISAKAATSQLGATKTNESLNVPQIFAANILPDFQSSAAVHPVVKVDCLKFLTIFRHHLARDQLASVFPLVIENLKNENYVVHTYAAVCLERLLFMKVPSGNPNEKPSLLFTAEDLKPVLPQLLENLFTLIEMKQTPEKISENDYLVKTLMRVIYISKGATLPYATSVIGRLTKVLELISRNPSNPKFNHYVFECIGLLVRFICSEDLKLVAEFENMLFPVIQAILATDIPEFTPYILQILAQLLEFHITANEKSIPAAYKPFLQPLLMPALWESHGNIPALVRLLQAYLTLGPNEIVSEGHLPAFLGIFQKLISSRNNDVFGFEFLLTIYEQINEANLNQYEKTIFTVFLTRLNGATKTNKFCLGVLNLLCELTGMKQDAERFIIVINTMQPKLFDLVMKNVLLPVVAKEAITNRLQKKALIAGLTRFLVSPSLLNGNSPVLPALLSEILRLIMQPLKTTEVENDDEDLVYAAQADAEETGYQSAFVRLHSIAKVQKDYSGLTQDVEAFVRQSLTNMRNSNPTQFTSTAGSLSAELQSQLTRLL